MRKYTEFIMYHPEVLSLPELEKRVFLTILEYHAKNKPISFEKLALSLYGKQSYIKLVKEVCINIEERGMLSLQRLESGRFKNNCIVISQRFLNNLPSCCQKTS